MGLIGAIIGDIIGSRFEFGKPKDFNAETVELITDDCFFTDDTVLSIATKWAIDNNMSFIPTYKTFTKEYPNKGYGDRFLCWATTNQVKPYNSYGNGSAMRISYIADKFETIEEVAKWAKHSAEVTHNHPEGIKGAVVTAVCSFMARKGKSKEEILEYAKMHYKEEDYAVYVGTPLNELRKKYHWNETCQGSVPLAIRCFYESEDYESFIRNVLSFNCDTDTIAAIGGCIAENFYGTTGFDNDVILEKFLDKDLLKILKEE